jgi:DNA-directed RNA polymerase specialized sigma24 family protein
MAVNNPATWLLNNYDKIKVPYGYNIQTWKEAKQDAFIKLYKTCYDITEKNSQQYVMRSLKNSYSRLNNKSKLEESDEQLAYIKQKEPEELYTWQSIKAIEKMKYLIELLPPKQKEAIIISLSDQDLAKAVNKTNYNYNTIKTHYRLGIIKLKQQMKGMKWD